MNARLQQIDAWFEAAMDLSPEQRTQFLAQLRTTDANSAAEVARLLDALDQPSPLDGRTGMRLEPAFVTPHAPGDWINGYQLERHLGQGGMGEVWLARGVGGAGNLVALKLIRSELSTAVLGERLRRERDLLARVSHPNIAALIDSGISAEGEPYLVIEYVEGEPLLAAAAKRKLSLRERVEIMLALSDAVAAAQTQLVVHRDIKPANVLLTPTGQPKLLDFGIAKALDSQGFGASTTLTRAFGAALTPAYAAPEQRAGAAVSTATDVYSLGVLMTELLLGQRPSGESASRLAAQGQLAAGIGMTARELSRALRGDLDVLLAKALAEQPEHRYINAEQLASDLRAYLSGMPLRAQPESFRYRVRKLLHRHRAASAIVFVALIAIVGSALIAWQRSIESRREAARAQYVQRFIESVMASDLPGAVRDQALSTVELLARGSQAAIADTTADPDARLALLLSLSRIQIGHRAYQEADQLLLAAESVLPQTVAPSWQRVAIAADRTALAYLMAPSSTTRAALELHVAQAQAQGADPEWQSQALSALITAAIDDDSGDAARRYAEQLLALNLDEPQAKLTALTQSVAAFSFDQQYRPRALDLAQQAFALSQQQFGTQHAQTAYAAMRLGNVLRIKGDIDAAAAQLETAVDVARRTYPTGHPQLARILEELARVRMRQQRVDEGALLWREIYAMRVAHSGEGSFPASRAASFLASALSRQGKFTEAAELALGAHANLQREIGPYNAQTIDALSYAGNALLQLGQSERARALLPDVDAALPAQLEALSRWRFRELQLLHVQTYPSAEQAAPMQTLIALLAAETHAPRDTAHLLLNAASIALDNKLTGISAQALAAAQTRIAQDDSTKQSEVHTLLQLLLQGAPREQILAAREVVVKRRGERHHAVLSADSWLNR